MRNLRTYSCAPIWVPSLCSRELGSIEPHQRGEGLRHPVGNHRHGAEHDADLQQRHRHLLRAALTLLKPSSFYRLWGETREASHVAQSSLLFHPGLRLGWSFFGHLQRSTGCERVGRGRVDRNGKVGIKLQHLLQWKMKRGVKNRERVLDASSG